MKARKWLYGTAALATAFNMHLLDLNALSSLLKVVKISEPIFRHSLISALLYLGFQFLVLTMQVVVTYDIIMSDRMRSRKDEDIRAAQARVDESRREVLSLEQELAQQMPRERGSVTISKSSDNPEAAQAAVDAATAVYHRNVHELTVLIGRDPSNRVLYRVADYIIDVVRIATPIIVTIIATFGLIAHW
jgi:hypothetical protein